MANTAKYKFDLDLITSNLELNKLNNKETILPLFQAHIKEVKEIGKFSVQDWSYEWRKSVYNFGILAEELGPSDFLKIIQDEKLCSSEEQQEVLDFYLSEIVYYIIPNDTAIKKINELIEKYPYNPEFYHTLGHLYRKDEKYEKAINLYNLAIEKDENNSAFLNTLFNCYKEYFDVLIIQSNYEKGLNIVNSLIARSSFRNDYFYYTNLLGVKERFNDYINLSSKIKDAEVSIKEIALTETQKGQNKLIEILGFFSAIIAFIFSTVSIGKNFSFREALLFNITLGLVLLLFVVAINLLFSKDKRRVIVFKASIFIVLLTTILILVLGSQSDV
jgi:tetratricopeptide (TPR) repeat protein